METRTRTVLFDDVVLHLGEGPQDDLSLIGRTVEALERAGHDHAVEAFLYGARLCQTEQQLLALMHRTVTVL